MQPILDIILLLVIIGTSMLAGAYFAARGFEKGMISLMEHMEDTGHGHTHALDDNDSRGHKDEKKD